MLAKHMIDQCSRAGTWIQQVGIGTALGSIYERRKLPMWATNVKLCCDNLSVKPLPMHAARLRPSSGNFATVKRPAKAHLHAAANPLARRFRFVLHCKPAFQPCTRAGSGALVPPSRRGATASTRSNRTKKKNHNHTKDVTNPNAVKVCPADSSFVYAPGHTPKVSGAEGIRC